VGWRQERLCAFGDVAMRYGIRLAGFGVCSRWSFEKVLERFEMLCDREVRLKNGVTCMSRRGYIVCR